jgi:hypothetical protein
VVHPLGSVLSESAQDLSLRPLHTNGDDVAAPPSWPAPRPRFCRCMRRFLVAKHRCDNPRIGPYATTQQLHAVAWTCRTMCMCKTLLYFWVCFQWCTPGTIDPSVAPSQPTYITRGMASPIQIASRAFRTSPSRFVTTTATTYWYTKANATAGSVSTTAGLLAGCRFSRLTPGSANSARPYAACLQERLATACQRGIHRFQPLHRRSIGINTEGGALVGTAATSACMSTVAAQGCHHLVGPFIQIIA